MKKQKKVTLSVKISIYQAKTMAVLFIGQRLEVGIVNGTGVSVMLKHTQTTIPLHVQEILVAINIFIVYFLTKTKMVTLHSKSFLLKRLSRIQKSGNYQNL